ncbi:YkgJ family cysteine cluster protein [Nitrospirillum iridis]|uniref:YkgJ family cysteine cluster protein n=1 Tax=Nitrospirillum iridis TaxID=765888 RepID=A0A7X0B6Y2_9PROT|nr:YkgJ family cysteine cluster protein [Nitrospirillum iridis]MBB6255294.1 hypothetical protein [Nitrospirillum iridis]
MPYQPFRVTVHSRDQADLIHIASGAHRAMEEGMDRMPKNLALPDGTIAPVACRLGCHHCCTQQVSLTLGEIALVAGHLAAQDDETRRRLAAAIRAALPRAAGRTLSQRKLDRMPCPLLGGDGACGLYAARPLACRAYLSADLDACRADAEAPDAGVAVPQPVAAKRGQIQLMLQLLQREAAAGFQGGEFELIQALNLVLDDDTAFTRARQGQDAFAAARVRA